MAINKIIKLNLQSRAADLKNTNKSLDEIASILSKESKQKITKSTLFRFYKSNDIQVAHAIHKSNKLTEKVAETEINTIDKRLEVIDKFLELYELAKKEGDYHSAQAALRGATDAQHKLDERIGKLTANNNNTNVNIVTIKEQIDAARQDVTSRVNSITIRLRERELLQQSN